MALLAVAPAAFQLDERQVARACARVVSEAAFGRLRRREALEPVVNRVRISGTKTIRWNGAAINTTRLMQYFAISTSMTPTPYLVVRIDRGADPALVARARDAIRCAAAYPPIEAWPPL